ncbi:MAG: hypothetical protein ACLRQF_08610 [Thomasclavelia ramosa]
MTVKAIKVSADGNKVTVTLERKNTNYEDVAGTISIKSNGYSDGNVDLTANLKLLKQIIYQIVLMLVMLRRIKRK